MKKEDRILDYHQQARSLFRTEFDSTLQSPFYLTPLQNRNLETSVGYLYNYLKRTYRFSGLFIARPEFIQIGDQFKLIDINVSSSITSYSYLACLRYWQNHPLNTSEAATEKIQERDFDYHLAKALRKICSAKKNRSLLILQEPFELFESRSGEAIANASRLQNYGLDVKLVNPRFASFRFDKNKITCDGIEYQTVLIGFLSKYAQQEEWLLSLLEKMRKSNVLVSDFATESQMMSKSNLLKLTTKNSLEGPALTAITLKEYLNIPASKRHKNAWVLKHVDGNNSEQVLIGRDTHRAHWEKALLQAEKDCWILQRYQSPVRHLMPVITGNKLQTKAFYPIFSPFVLNGRMRGVLVKAYTKGHQGSYELVPGLAVTKS